VRPANTTTGVEVYPVQTGRKSATVADAVLDYIKVMRSLGHDRINTSAISDALNVSHSEVLQAIVALRKKGVKLR
jgi:Mn-dependent DtxR family transcriptional regulator